MTEIDLFEDSVIENPALQKYTKNSSDNLGIAFYENIDFERRLFVLMFVWLICNLVLIHFAWRFYGDSLSERFNKGWK